jgi:hypothetical protein
VRVFSGAGLAVLAALASLATLATLGAAVGTMTGRLVGSRLTAAAPVEVGRGTGLLTAKGPVETAWQANNSQANSKVNRRIWDCF